MNYVPLQLKTSYSLLESLNNIPKLISYAKELGYQSLAITDTNNMFGVMEFYQECQKNNIKPIIGLELTLDNYTILLYAINNQGYKNTNNCGYNHNNCITFDYFTFAQTPSCCAMNHHNSENRSCGNKHKKYFICFCDKSSR